MKFESFTPSVESEGKEPIPFPQEESAVEAYLGQYEGETKRAGILREVFQEFLKEELENSKLFKSESGVEMPYTSINIEKLARRIYEKASGQTLSLEEKDLPPVRQQFVFATSPVIKDGDQFTTIEFAMHGIVKALPAILEKLRKGEPVENEEVVTVGMPTNVLGRIPPELAEKIVEKPFDELAGPYADLIAAHIQSREERPQGVELLGMSLGANLAIRTAEALMDKKVVTQDRGTDKKDIPFLQIRAEVPVSRGPSKIKPFQILAGFVLDGALEMASRPDVRRAILSKDGKAFKEATRKWLAEKGMEIQMSGEQKSIKNRVIRSIILKLGKGLIPRLETKITEVFGLKDPTSITLGLRAEAKKQKKEYGGTLGQNILSRTSPNERRFAVDMMHTPPWFRENELQRMDALAKKIESLKA